MFLRILLGVACLSLMTASTAEAQLFRRLLAPRQVQPQQYTPPTGYSRNGYSRNGYSQNGNSQNGYSQNGYQGRLTATARTQQLYVRRSDGSVVRYYPANSSQAAVIRNRQVVSPSRQVVSPSRQVVVSPSPGALIRPVTQQPKLATTQGKLEAVRPSEQVRGRVNSVYQSPTSTFAAQQASVAPVGVSVVNRPTLGSISPATPMPQASVSSAPSASSAPAVASAPSVVDPASAIPVSKIATNPVPGGLSLSLTLTDDDVVPASATVPVESPSTGQSSEQESFSVLETIE